MPDGISSFEVFFMLFDGAYVVWWYICGDNKQFFSHVLSMGETVNATRY